MSCRSFIERARRSMRVTTSIAFADAFEEHLQLCTAVAACAGLLLGKNLEAACRPSTLAGGNLALEISAKPKRRLRLSETRTRVLGPDLESLPAGNPARRRTEGRRR